jgi:SAM-dependent methyltransferase
MAVMPLSQLNRHALRARKPKRMTPMQPALRGVDRMRNPGAVISNEIIAFELVQFLENNFSRQSGAVLDLGAGTKPYAPLYELYFETCKSVDVPYSVHDLTGVDVMASADDLPFEGESFDCVICTEVLEHCAEPHEVMQEIARVLKPGGHVFLTTPFLRPLHEMPHDYYRYTPSGLRHRADRAGLLVESIRPRGEYVAVALSVMQMPLGKLFYLIAKWTRLPLTRVTNPVVYLGIVAPQKLYVSLWRRARHREGRLRRLHDKLSYYTLGYVTELTRPER